MSFVQRRRFLWILFLVALALLAVVASATTLSRLRFEELAQRATAVARLRCLGAEAHWENREIWNGHAIRSRRTKQRPASGTGHDSNAWRNYRRPAFASRRSSGVSRGRRGVRISLGPRRRASPHPRLVAGNVSHCERCANRSGNRYPGFRGCTTV